MGMRGLIATVIGTTTTVALLVGTPRAAAAQGVTTGAIAGRVTDDAGRPLDAVQVQVVNRSTGFVTGATTRASGQYFVQGLEVDNSYTVTVHKIGFQSQSQLIANVVLEQTTRADFKLPTAVVTLETVRVAAQRATSGVSPAARAGVGTTISDSLIHSQPSLNRQYTDFVNLTPEISNQNSKDGFSASGVNSSFNTIQIDGSTEADLFGLGSTGQPGGQAGAKSISIESIKEYQVLLSPYDVRDGQFAGALINAVTKSGTNDFHGSAYEYYRNQAIGRTQPYIPIFNESQYGASLGGPIIPDRALFFVNAEFQTESRPANGPIYSSANPGLQADINTFKSLAAAAGIPTGSAGVVQTRNPVSNFFARLDFILPFNTQLILHDNYAHADLDDFSRSTSSFPLSSNGYTFESTKNAAVAELRTNLPSGAYNEAIFNWETIRDPRNPVVTSPQITVTDNTYHTSIISGSNYASQGNRIYQDLLEFRENFSYPIGDHELTVGTQDQFYHVLNLFAENSYGVWSFQNLDSLAAGIAHEYQIGVPAPGSGDGAVRFHEDNFSGYFQDKWAPSPRFNLTAGIRLDIPYFVDKPPTNPLFEQQFGINTNDIPSGNIQFNPRIGFNWDITGDNVNVLRGGVGSFQGAPAYVWLSNAFQNSGVSGYQQLTCSTANPAPNFNANHSIGQPTQCANGLTPAAGGEIDLISKNFRYPQDFKGSLGYDRALGGDWTWRAEGLYTHAIYNPWYQNLALGAPIGTNLHGLPVYGDDNGVPTSLVNPSRLEVIEIQNENKSYSYSISSGFLKQFSARFSGAVFYTYSQARDVMSLTSTTAYSNYRYSDVANGREDQARLQRSDFEVPNKIVTNLKYILPTKTSLSVYYIGQSGQPYNFTYQQDANGDGTSGNDPIWVPTNVKDPNQIQFAGTPVQVAAEQAAFAKFLKENPCVGNQAGHYMAFASCRTPWAHTVNLSIEQPVPLYRTHTLTLRVDLFNALNFFNNNWGHVYEAESNTTLLTGFGQTGGFSKGGQPLVSYSSTGGNPALTLNEAASNYQFQFGAKYSF
jgi:hypothetical protein